MLCSVPVSACGSPDTGCTTVSPKHLYEGLPTWAFLQLSPREPSGPSWRVSSESSMRQDPASASTCSRHYAADVALQWLPGWW